LPCENTGQVKQRIEGFISSKYSFILQLDDDILLDDLCLEILYDQINFFNYDVAIGPKYSNQMDGTLHSFLSPKDIKLFTKTFYRLLNGADGYVGGKISKSGLNMGVEDFTEDFLEVDWLPGGCILYKKKNIIIKNYYPFSGKAYSEDVIHSILLSKNRIKLYVSGDAKCSVKFDKFNIKSKNIFKHLFVSLKAKEYVAHLKGANILRLKIAWLWYIINCIYIRIPIFLKRRRIY